MNYINKQANAFVILIIKIEVRNCHKFSDVLFSSQIACPTQQQMFIRIKFAQKDSGNVDLYFFRTQF